jgi:hypothetical protein
LVSSALRAASSAAVSLPKTIWRPGPAWTTSSWPAADVEALVTDALGNVSSNAAASQIDIRNLIDRIVIGRATIRIQLSEVAEGTDSARILTLPWTWPSPYRKREIIQGANDAKTYARPMPANARAILIDALRDAHRWVDELLSDPRLALESIASRECKTVRSIRMTLSLAFLAPERKSQLRPQFRRRQFEAPLDPYDWSCRSRYPQRLLRRSRRSSGGFSLRRRLFSHYGYVRRGSFESVGADPDPYCASSRRHRRNTYVSAISAFETARGFHVGRISGSS